MGFISAFDTGNNTHCVICYLQWFWRITEAGVMEGHPVETRRFWFGLPPELSHIDAVYERVGDGRIVFFSGNSRTF